MDIWAVSAALRAENYVELDRYFNDKQSAYEKGAIDDLSLSGFFCLTGTSRADLLPFTQAWIAAYPESYAAHHIRAELLFLVGVHVALRARRIPRRIVWRSCSSILMRRLSMLNKHLS